MRLLAVAILAAGPLAEAALAVRSPRALVGAVQTRLLRHSSHRPPHRVAPALAPRPASSAPPLALMPLIIPGIRTIGDAALFPVVNAVLPAWFLLIFFPRWKGTAPVVKFTCMAFAALYVTLLIPLLCASGGAGFAKMSSLAGVTEMFAQPSAVFIGWVHYVVFDLWTAQYIVTDAKKVHADRAGNLWRVPHALVAPCLVATCLAGPAGFLAYAILRAACVKYRQKKRSY